MTNTQRASHILAMETSCSTASLTLFADGRQIFSESWTALRSHNSRIFDVLKKARPFLTEYKPELILVGAGPGSYSGIRVALAVADGLSLIYGAGVVAVNSWEALPHEGKDALILSDARRGGWALGQLKAGKWEGILTIQTKEEALQAVKEAKLHKRNVFSCEDKEKLNTNGFVDISANCIPSASGLIASWNQKTTEEQSILRNTTPAPLYVREPNITPAKKAAWQKNNA